MPIHFDRGSAALAAVLLALGPSGGCGRPATEDALLVRAVQVTPDTVTLGPGETQRFASAVSGSVDPASPVTWSLGAGNAGTIDADGTYHAPAVSPLAPVQVRATSTVNPGVYGEATVDFVPRGVTVTPEIVDVVLGGATVFTAAVQGAVDQAVTWRCRLGTVDADGVYQAPVDGLFDQVADVITATSVANGAEASATIRLRVAPPVLTALSGPAAAGDTLTITGTGLAPYMVMAATVVFFPDGAGGTIAVIPERTNTQLLVKVPSGAASGPVYVELQGGDLYGTARSNSLPFARAPRLRMHAARSELASGESTPLSVALLGAPGPVPISFDVDDGVVSDGVYTAPVVSQPTYVNVRACVTGTANCSGSTLAVRPFRTEPAPALVTPGASLSLGAADGTAALPATFSLVAGGGSMSSGGTFTAPTALADAGQAWVLAQVGGTQAPVQVGVTDQVPGLVHRVVDHVDHRRVDDKVGAPLGSYVEALAVAEGRAYVVATQPVTLYASRTYFWIDVYDLSEPLRPAWLGAIESATRPDRLLAAGGHLYAFSQADWSHGMARTLAVYDLAGPLPSLEALEITEGASWTLWAPPVADASSVFFFGDPTPDGTIPLKMQPLAGAASARVTGLPLPPDADAGRVDAVTASGDRAWASYMDVQGAWWVGAWDLAVEPPAFLGAAEGGASSLGIAGTLLVAGWNLYDVSGPVPVQVGGLPNGGSLVAASASRAIVRGQQSGFYVLDLSDPAVARLDSVIYAGLPMSHGSGSVVDDLLYYADGFGGVAIFDVAPAGGPRVVRGWGGLAANALVVHGGHLYAAGDGFIAGTGRLLTWDLSTTPATLLDTRVLTSPAYAMVADDDGLLVGTMKELQRWSLAEPALPSLVWSMDLGVNALRSAGGVAWVGTLAGDLIGFDLAVPGGPVEVGRIALGAVPYTIDALTPGGLTVGLAASSSGDLVVLDVSDPAHPVEAKRAGLGVPVYASVLEGATLLLSTAAGLVTVDVSDPSAPVPLVAVGLPGVSPFGDTAEAVPTWALGTHGGIAWVGTAYANGAIHGFDVRQPAWPREVARAALGTVTGEVILSVAFDGTRGFVGVGNTVVELDLAQPRNVVMTLGADPSLQR